MPASFIPLAEETGQILAVGDWVLSTACKQLKAWTDTSLRHLSVNVSPLQFRQENFILRVEDILAETGADPKQLKLEFTEGVLLKNIKQAIEKMEVLRRLGIRFSIDDFGTGYSSLAYLKRLPLDEIKIDRSFIRDTTSDPSDAKLVEIIISIAAQFGLEVVAEGVETVDQLEFLVNKKRRNFQGYYFSRPLAAENLTGLLNSKKHKVSPEVNN